MLLKRVFLLPVFLLLFAFTGLAQDVVTWKYSAKKISNDEVELTLEAKVSAAYHMYSMEKFEDGPLPLEFSFTPSADYKLVGNVVSSTKPKEGFDKDFEINLKYYEGSAKFVQKIKVLGSKPFVIKGSLSYQACGEGACIPGDDDFSFSITADLLSTKEEAKKEPVEQQVASEAVDGNQATGTEEKVAEELAGVKEEKSEVTTATISEEPTTEKTKEGGSESIWGFVLLAIAAGLGAVFTPCVFPMIPMTVSFFISGSSSRFSTIMKALIFSLSVALTYGIIGVVVAIFKNPEIATFISDHWVSNLIFATMFIIFSASFFGMFEITLPTGIANKADRQVDKGGYAASFFMALVLAIVSFSCTGPFVGSLLPEAASGVSIAKPILGLFFFGFALSSPFLLLAIFPSMLEKIPKSGGWLNSVKVVFAFMMLALCVKFISMAGLSLGVVLVSRTVAIAIWIVLAILLGMYLLGKLKFSHDSDLPYVSVPRFGLAVAALAFAIYLVPGLFGADLEVASAFLPAKDESVLDLTQQQAVVSGNATAAPLEAPCGGSPKYSDTKMHFPKGIVGYFDVNEGLACAKEQNKPVLLDFKGFSCGNCKKMEASAFSDPRVIEFINKEFIMIALYNDEKAELPASEQGGVSINGKPIVTLGQKNSDYQKRKFNSISRPYFAIVDGNETVYADGLGYADADELLAFLNKGLEAFKKAQQ